MRTFDKKVLKKQFHKTTKALEHAFLASLSDLNSNTKDSSSSLSNDESVRKVVDKLNSLCFLTDSTLNDLCTMAFNSETVGDDVNNFDTDSKIPPSID